MTRINEGGRRVKPYLKEMVLPIIAALIDSMGDDATSCCSDCPLVTLLPTFEGCILSL